MTIDLYESPVSPYCRSVKVLAKIIGIPLNLVQVKLQDGEQKSPEFMEKNPFHEVPVLVDNGFTLFESRAILTYLTSKYAPESNLYPTDLQQRAQVDAMILFDYGSLASSIGARLRSKLATGNDLGEAAIERSRDMLKNLNLLLSRRKYAAGDNLTLADITIVHTLGLLEFVEDYSDLTNLTHYYRQVAQELEPAYSEVNEGATEKLREYFAAAKSKISST